eukprot:CAMPEP_0197526888 /NCGR_PEP_ID=MMETSP1318-20131121/19614_1 /TAXON_ID=552666 /ORGANISM="Partenskyella glossopodia, Strain RCC365" /LENGTH=193 /DNA_ID=CAMNT_0043081265 /DNA_START=11 /DNA_END=592 /DNA_ORIENTATION=+
MAWHTPPGFFAANETLNDLPEALLKAMIRDAVIMVLERKIHVMPIKEYTKNAGDISESEITSATNACLYIVRQLSSDSKSNTDRKAANSILVRETDLSKPVRAAFVLACIPEDGAKQVKRVLNVGKLVDFKWKIGMGISSTSCTALKSPFVSIQLSISDQNQKIQHHNLELTIKQFQDLRQTFKNILTQMEQV